jgi:Flp pilus assembly protein TadD
MKRLWVLALASVLAGCSGGTAPVAQGRPAAKVQPADLVATVRAAGAGSDTLDVQPLRDPQVEDLRLQADALEARGKYKPALAAINQALAITPGDPELLQRKAELALYVRAWPDAERFAAASYEAGPKLGGLCRRNWTTVQLARERRGDAAGAALARKQVDACTVAPPVRL